jgi:tetratricopeptide (TPR) repeat protein
VDHRSDIYSLGIILYEMLTGRVPFEAETALAVAMKHKSEIPIPAQKLNLQIPEDLNRLILKCLEKDPKNRYQTAQTLLDDLIRLQDLFPTTEREIPKGKPGAVREKTGLSFLKKIGVPAIAFAGMAAVAVIIWQIFPQKETVLPPTDKPSLAIMYFKNNTGDENFNHWRTALTDLMITDLSQSKYIRILSGEILYNILSQLDLLDANTYSSDMLKKVAERGGVKNILIGNYTKAEDTFRLNITLQDPRTGELVASESVEGVGERSFYTMVDELTKRIKENFALTEEEITQDLDSQIATITTSSPEAFKLYSEGRAHHMRAEYRESIASMQKALEIDPQFAMAWRSVAMSYNNMGNRPGRIKAIQKAFEQRSRVSERERYIIEADYYKTWEKTYDRAMEAYLELLELYPEDVIGNTNLGILYFELEEWDKAIELYNINIKNYPDTLISLWNLVETYMAMGLYDKAIETAEQFLSFYPEHYGFQIKIVRNLLFQEKYEKALDKLEEASALNPEDTEGINIYRGNTYLLQGDLAKTRKHFEQLPEDSIAQRISLAALYLLQGKFEEALAQYRKNPVLHQPLAILLLRTGHPEQALEEIEILQQKAVESENLSWQILILYAKGRAFLLLNSQERAQQTADEIKKLVDTGFKKKHIRYYHHLMGMITQARGEIPQAIRWLILAVDSLYSPEDNFPDIHALFISPLAELHYKSGNLDKAADAYNKVISLGLGRLFYGDIYARSLYMLGRIFEEKGQKREAVNSYEDFLRFWQNADPSTSEVSDARQRLAALKNR